MNTRQIGNIFEKKSIKYLIKKNYKIVTQNYYTRFGEIDIIAKKNETFYIIEVKSEKKTSISSIFKMNSSKKKRIIKTALHYIEKNNLKNTQIVFSLIVVNDSKIEYYENIINEDFYFHDTENKKQF